MTNEYAWEDLQVSISGRNAPLEGITDIDFGISRNHVNLAGRGREPVSMGRGRKEYKPFKFTILQSELEALQDGLPAGQHLTDRAPFTIVASFVPEDNSPRVTYKVLGCRITDQNFKLGADDPNAEVTLEALPFRIVRTR